MVVRLLQRYERVESRMPAGKEVGMSSDIVLQPAGEVSVAFLPGDGGNARLAEKTG